MCIVACKYSLYNEDKYVVFCNDLYPCRSVVMRISCSSIQHNGFILIKLSKDIHALATYAADICAFNIIAFLRTIAFSVILSCFHCMQINL